MGDYILYLHYKLHNTIRESETCLKMKLKPKYEFKPRNEFCVIIVENWESSYFY
jgi:hypothetical protein